MKSTQNTASTWRRLSNTREGNANDKPFSSVIDQTRISPRTHVLKAWSHPILLRGGRNLEVGPRGRS